MSLTRNGNVEGTTLSKDTRLSMAHANKKTNFNIGSPNMSNLGNSLSSNHYPSHSMGSRFNLKQVETKMNQTNFMVGDGMPKPKHTTHTQVFTSPTGAN